MRKVKLIQNNKRQSVDLYEIMFGLNPSTSFSQILKEDALVIVPPIGETIALDGDLPSPGIYEVNKNETIKQFLEFSGGLNSPEKLLFDRQKVGSDGFDELELNITNNTQVKMVIFL